MNFKNFYIKNRIRLIIEKKKNFFTQKNNFDFAKKLIWRKKLIFEFQCNNTLLILFQESFYKKKK